MLCVVTAAQVAGEAAADGVVEHQDDVHDDLRARHLVLRLRHCLR